MAVILYVVSQICCVFTSSDLKEYKRRADAGSVPNDLSSGAASTSQSCVSQESAAAAVDAATTHAGTLKEPASDAVLSSTVTPPSQSGTCKDAFSQVSHFSEGSPQWNALTALFNKLSEGRQDEMNRQLADMKAEHDAKIAALQQALLRERELRNASMKSKEDAAEADAQAARLQALADRQQILRDQELLARARKARNGLLTDADVEQILANPDQVERWEEASENGTWMCCACNEPAGSADGCATIGCPGTISTHFKAWVVRPRALQEQIDAKAAALKQQAGIIDKMRNAGKRSRQALTDMKARLDRIAALQCQYTEAEAIDRELAYDCKHWVEGRACGTFNAMADSHCRKCQKQNSTLFAMSLAGLDDVMQESETMVSMTMSRSGLGLDQESLASMAATPEGHAMRLKRQRHRANKNHKKHLAGQSADREKNFERTRKGNIISANCVSGSKEDFLRPIQVLSINLARSLNRTVYKSSVLSCCCLSMYFSMFVLFLFLFGRALRIWHESLAWPTSGWRRVPNRILHRGAMARCTWS